jgi:hypothetical protein
MGCGCCLNANSAGHSDFAVFVLCPHRLIKNFGWFKILPKNKNFKNIFKKHKKKSIDSCFNLPIFS